MFCNQISYVLRVAGVQGEHGDGDELDDRPQKPETEDVVEILEEIPFFQRVPLPALTKVRGGAVRGAPGCQAAMGQTRPDQ